MLISALSLARFQRLSGSHGSLWCKTCDAYVSMTIEFTESRPFDASLYMGFLHQDSMAESLAYLSRTILSTTWTIED
jgi:hypothetical protein